MIAAGQPGARAWTMWATANRILNTATEPTPTLVWAAGVKALHHSISLAGIWAAQHPLDGEYGGGCTLDHGRRYEIRSGRFTIRCAGEAVTAVRTRDIEAQVTEDRLPAALVAACRELHVERRRLSVITQDHSDRRIRCDNPPSMEEVLAHGDQWADIERRCRDAAADVWESVRPQEKPVQLDLFDLAGGAR